MILILILSIFPLDDVDTMVNGVNHHACCTGGNFEMELTDLDMCSAPTTTETDATDEGMSDGGSSAATKERVTIAIGMVLVGAALLQ